MTIASSPTLHLGIDPGKHGAMAIVRYWPAQDIRPQAVAELVGVEDMPLWPKEDVHSALGSGIDAWKAMCRVRFMLGGGQLASAAVERVHSSSQMGVTSAFNFGDAFGVARAVAVVSGMPEPGTLPARSAAFLLSYPTPEQWRKTVKVAAGPERKANARNLAMQLFPEHGKSFARVKDDGRADAALIALAAAERWHELHH